MRAVAAAPWALECEEKGGRSSVPRVYIFITANPSTRGFGPRLLDQSRPRSQDWPLLSFPASRKFSVGASSTTGIAAGSAFLPLSRPGFSRLRPIPVQRPLNTVPMSLPDRPIRSSEVRNLAIGGSGARSHAAARQRASWALGFPIPGSLECVLGLARLGRGGVQKEKT